MGTFLPGSLLYSDGKSELLCSDDLSEAPLLFDQLYIPTWVKPLRIAFVVLLATLENCKITENPLQICYKKINLNFVYYSFVLPVYPPVEVDHDKPGEGYYYYKANYYYYICVQENVVDYVISHIEDQFSLQGETCLML